jgi:Tfp pilus assembly protein PilF
MICGLVQLVMIMAGSTLDELDKKILTEKDALLHYFKKASNQRLAKRLYNPSFEQKDIQGKLLRDYGWMLFRSE